MVQSLEFKGLTDVFLVYSAITCNCMSFYCNAGSTSQMHVRLVDLMTKAVHGSLKEAEPNHDQNACGVVTAPTFSHSPGAQIM